MLTISNKIEKVLNQEEAQEMIEHSLIDAQNEDQGEHLGLDV